MNVGRAVPLLAGAVVLLVSISSGSWAQDGPLTVGPNINMVSGTQWPEGDPFLRQQNEPSVAFSSRNKLHLLSGANDYRTVDVPGDFEAGATGDSWLSYFWTTNGGGTWKSTLIPGYPQDQSEEGLNSPLKGYAAGADPVVRAGTHGLFYYSGIAFERTENPGSAIFVTRFIDLNNDEGGDPIRYIDTMLVDVDSTGERFLDKSWVAVDLPRQGAASKTFNVRQRDGSMVNQTVSCGNVYVAYAALTGDGPTLRSEIMLTSSSNCGDSWSVPQPISEEDTLNQGANIAINPSTGSVHIGWRRFDTVEAFLGTPSVSCSKPVKDWRRKKKAQVAVEWPVENVDIGDLRLSREEALDLLSQKPNDDGGNESDKSIKLAQYLVAAKLNLVSGGGQPSEDFDPAEWTRTLAGLVDESDIFFRENPLQVYEGKKSKKSKKSDKSGKKSKKSDKSDKSKKSKKSKKDDWDYGEDWDDDEYSRTVFTGSRLSKQERREANALREQLKDNYLGSEDCIATAGTDPISTGASNAMVATSSSDGGASWAPASTVAEIRTFDQGGTNFSFRTTAYPSLAVDKAGRVYMAFAARGFATARPDEETGDSRIVMAISNDGGSSWQAPYAIDDDPEKPGHQFKPSLLFAGARLVVVFYDLRADVSGIFEQFVLDVPEPDRLRHTLDVRAATAATLAAPLNPQFTLYDVSDRQDSQQASRYAFVATGTGVPVDTVQLQYMVPNLPTHAGGTQPFIGDYVDVAAKVYLKDGDIWRYATEPGDVDVYQAVWTDNRDITPPPDGDWTKYQPLNLDNGGGGNVSVFDGSPIPACEPGVTSQFTGTRNQNVYSATLSEGLIVAAPGSNRPLGTAADSSELLERAYVIFTQNVTAFERTFRLTVSPPQDGDASFEQFSARSSVDVTVPPFSSTVKTVFASSPNPDALIAVLVQELDPAGEVLPGGLFSTVLLNADPSAPPPLNASLLTAETHNPTVLNPTVLNPTVLNPTVLNPTVLNPTVFNPTVFNPTVLNPTVFNPTVFNPTVLNPTVFNPTVLNPTVFNPTVLNPTVLNPTVFNPTVFNPTILNPTVLNPTVFNPTVLNPTVLNPTVLNTAVEPSQQSAEVTFAVQNDGNSTSSYDIDLASSQGADDGFSYQVLVYRLNKTPVADGCGLVEEAQQELIANVLEPGNLLDPAGGDGATSFYVEPGEEVFVTIRVLPDTDSPNPGDPGDLDDTNLDLAISVVPQAVNSDDAEMGETTPTGTSTTTAPVPPVVISTTEIPDGIAGEPYTATLAASGGIAPLSWSLALGAELPDNLSLSASGVLSGTPVEPGELAVPVRVTDGIQVAEASFFATIEPPPLLINTNSLPSGTFGDGYPVTVLSSTGGFGTIDWSVAGGNFPPGLNLALDGTISGVPSAAGSFSFVVEATDGYQSVQQNLSIAVAEDLVVGGTGGSPWALNCPIGSVATGIRGTAGDDIDDIELVCRQVTDLSGGFPMLGAEVSGGVLNNGGGSNFGDILVCPADNVMQGFRARVGNAGFGVIVDQLGVRCLDSNGSISDTALVGLNSSSGPLENAGCSAGDYVLGITGRSGAVLDQIGVTCGPAVSVFVASELAPKYYAVEVATPGFISRSGQVLEFSQSPRTGAVLTFSESGGEPDNRTFSWDVVDGKLVIVYDTPVTSNAFNLDLNETTATPDQLQALALEAQARGNPIAATGIVSVSQTAYSRVTDSVVDVVEKEDTQRTDYDPIVLFNTTGETVQLAPKDEVVSSSDTLREADTLPTVPLSASCSGGNPCVAGTWGGTARYSPGNRYFDGSVFPTTNYGELLSFTEGATQTVAGEISGLSASWSVVNGSLEIVYADGWTQTATVAEVNGLEYGVFSEYSNGAQRYTAYDIWVKRDPAFVISDAYLNSAPDKYWNGEINAWIPGNTQPDGGRIPTSRFGWDLDASTDPNTGFNRRTGEFDANGDGVDDLTLFLRPLEWAVEGSGRVKIDRFLDTEFSSYDRYWYPLASTVVGGDRQFYVIELEERGGDLGDQFIAARLNIEREIAKQDDYDAVQVQTPVIISDAVISGFSPDPVAAGNGQLAVISGSNLPTGNPELIVTQFGVEYTSGFSFVFDSSNHLVQLPSPGLVAGTAQLQLAEQGSVERSPPFPITISVEPAAPVLVDARKSFAEPSTPVGTVEAGGVVTVLARNTDTNLATAIFDLNGTDTTSPLASTTVPFGPNGGLLHEFNVPAGLPTGASVGVTLTVNVNAVSSPESNSVLLQVCDSSNISVAGAPAAVSTSSTLGFAVADGDTRYVRYDLGNATFAGNLSSTALSVGGSAIVSLFSGGLTGDSSVIFQVTAQGADLLASTGLTLNAGSVTISGPIPSLRVNVATYETATDSISQTSPLYLTGPSCD